LSNVLGFCAPMKSQGYRGCQPSSHP